jgi:hypothetical protein
MGFNWCFKTPIGASKHRFQRRFVGFGRLFSVKELNWVCGFCVCEKRRGRARREEKEREKNNKKYLQAATVNFIYESSL